MTWQFGQRIANAARALKREAVVLQLALRDPRVPLLPKMLAVLTLAYLVSPIDLIPDFIPVLGLLDDLILVPLAISLALWLIPKPVVAALRAEAAARNARIDFPAWPAVLAVVALWVLAGIALWSLLIGT